MGDLNQPQSGPAIRRIAMSTSAADLCDDEILTCLVGHIYDAALDSALWTDALPRIGRFVGGEAGGILSKDTISKAGSAHYSFGVDPHYVRLYAETYSRCDPVATLPFFDVEQTLSIPELVPYESASFGNGCGPSA
jgi:hypothetical protein